MLIPIKHYNHNSLEFHDQKRLNQLGVQFLSDFVASVKITPYSKNNYEEILENDNIHRPGKMSNCDSLTLTIYLYIYRLSTRLVVN